MQTKTQVLVTLRSGKSVEFSVTCYEDYLALVREAARCWFRWLSIGPTATVRKSEIVGMFYIGEGHGGREEHEEAGSDDELRDV